MGKDWTPPEHTRCVAMCHTSTTGAEHRREQIMAHKTWPGRCRVCLEVIRKKDGKEASRSWHPECWQRYALRCGNMQYIRAFVFKRDRGVCADCGKQDEQLNGEWAADHTIPLIDGGGFEMDNLQTLCHTPCHQRKTASEATRRAAQRRHEKRMSGPQLSIVL